MGSSIDAGIDETGIGGSAGARGRRRRWLGGCDRFTVYRFGSLAAQLFYSRTDRLEIVGSATVG